MCSGMKRNVRKAHSRIVIPSGAEGSFSFAVFCFLHESVCGKRRDCKSNGTRCFPFSVVLLFCLTANEKDFSHSLEMTIRDGGGRHSPSFCWKEVPRRGGGWLPQRGERECEGSGILVFQTILISLADCVFACQ